LLQRILVVNGPSRRVALPRNFGRKRSEAEIQQAVLTMRDL
jgi:hypothetical protein